MLACSRWMRSCMISFRGMLSTLGRISIADVPMVPLVRNQWSSKATRPTAMPTLRPSGASNSSHTIDLLCSAACCRNSLKSGVFHSWLAPPLRRGPRTPPVKRSGWLASSWWVLRYSHSANCLISECILFPRLNVCVDCKGASCRGSTMRKSALSCKRSIVV